MTYFAGRSAKESVPVILLHGLKGSRKDFAQDGGLASYLQRKLGCAVVVPDLRGHGDSKTMKNGKKTETLKAEKLQPRQFALMATQDLKAVKDFLWQKNNAGELNIDKLCLVGSEMGADVALDYALFDSIGYDQATAHYGHLKLGEFVKAVAMISPDWSFRGLNTKRALASPYVSGDIAMMILVGKGDPKYLSDAERYNSALEKTHSGPDEDKKETKTLWYGQLDTTLQGTKLLNEASLNAQKHIGLFLYYRIIKNPDATKWAWKERKLPHQ
jgi:pimeloyl-ACP methyl ester carboxylesterase